MAAEVTQSGVTANGIGAEEIPATAAHLRAPNEEPGDDSADEAGGNDATFA